jgi:CHAT domain
MSKLVLLDLAGNLQQQGFHALLEIRSEAGVPLVKAQGQLPPASDLAAQLQQHWQQHYRGLGLAEPRIKGHRILYKGSLQRRIADCQASAHQVRDRFLAWLNAPSFQLLDRRLRESLDRHEQIRVLLRTDVTAIQKLPWHEWDFFEQYTQADIAFSPLSYESWQPSAPAHSSKKVRILAIFGHAQGLDLDSDRAQLETLPNAEILCLVEPTRQHVNDALWERPWDILFFAGHSQTHPSQDQTRSLQQGETGRIDLNPTDQLSLSELKYGLRRAIAQGLQLAIFNSCDGLGLAHELQHLHLPQMIVMREPIADSVAHSFLTYFLAAYAQGLPLHLATRQARERLQGLEQQFPCASWLPLLLQSSIANPPTWQDLIQRSHPIPPIPSAIAPY